MSLLVRLLKVTGVLLVTRIAETKTSSSCFGLIVSLGFSCEKDGKEIREKIIDAILENRKLRPFVPLWQM